MMGYVWPAGPPFFRSYHVLGLTLFVLFEVADGSDRQRHVYGVGRRSYRAPKTCSQRPDYCTSNQTQQEPWTCKQEGCSLRKIDDIISSDSKATNVAKNLTASVYYHNSSKGCHHALNLTWTTVISDDVVGFLLRVTRHGPSKNVFNRTTNFLFWIDRSRFARERERDTEPGTFFYSDCLRLIIASTHRLTLFSLHRSVPNSEEVTSQWIGETRLVTDCDTYPDADPAVGRWAAYTTVEMSDSNSTANVYFTPAPHSFGFTSYDLSILGSGAGSGSEAILARISNLTFTCTNIGVVIVRNICSGDYTVKVHAFGGHCPCDSCSLCSRRWPFVVQGSNYRCPSDVIVEVPSLGINVPSTPIRIPAENSSSSAASAAAAAQESRSSNAPPVNAGVVASACAIVAFTTIAGIAICVKLRRSHNGHAKGVVAEANESDENVADVETSLDKRVVLLVYAKDSVHHCDVVRAFASYLQRRCYCEVKLDRWYADKISETSALDWLLRHIQTVENVVVVNSEGGWRRYEADAANSPGFQRIRQGGDSSPIEDLFLPALKQLRSEYYYFRPLRNHRRHHHRVFKVAFPYTRPEHFVNDIHPGRTYRLMDHVEDLFLNIHGLSKHGRNGRVTTAVGVNGAEYAGCPEGRRLEEAVARAVEYYRATPNWFSVFYHQKTEPENGASSICDSSSESRKKFTRSNLDFDLAESRTGTFFVPPSSLFFVPPFLDSGTGGDDYDSVSSLSLNVATTIEMMNEDYDRTIDLHYIGVKRDVKA